MTNQEFIESISLEGEEWKNVVGYEDCYYVSSLGRLISKARYVRHYRGRRMVKAQVIKPKVSKSTGYLEVCLYKCGVKRTLLLHRIVAEAFIPNPFGKPQVDHIDRNKLNNIVSNLHWCTGSENMLNPLTRPILKNINMGRKRPYAYRPTVAIKDGIVVYRFNRLMQCEEYGFDYTQVSSCCVGRQKTHKGYTFMYLSDYESQVSMLKNH